MANPMRTVVLPVLPTEPEERDGRYLIIHVAQRTMEASVVDETERFEYAEELIEHHHMHDADDDDLYLVVDAFGAFVQAAYRVRNVRTLVRQP